MVLLYATHLRVPSFIAPSWHQNSQDAQTRYSWSKRNCLEYQAPASKPTLSYMNVFVSKKFVSNQSLTIILSERYKREFNIFSMKEVGSVGFSKDRKSIRTDPFNKQYNNTYVMILSYRHKKKILRLLTQSVFINWRSNKPIYGVFKIFRTLKNSWQFLYFLSIRKLGLIVYLVYHLLRY